MIAAEGEDSLEQAVRTHRVPLSAIVAIVVQTIGLVIWLVQLGAEVKQMRQEVTVLQSKLEDLNEKGSRALDPVRSRQTDMLAASVGRDQRIRELETKLNVTDKHVNDVEGQGLQQMKTQIEIVNSNIKRFEDQQQRILQALDANYNLINEHIRSHNQNPAGRGPR